MVLLKKKKDRGGVRDMDTKKSGWDKHKSSGDPMIDILMDKNAIEIMSTLIAKMESITFDEGRTCVFKTSWGRSLFATCADRMLSGTMGGAKVRIEDDSERPFDIDEWFRSRVKHSTKVRRDIDSSLYQQPIDTDWLSALLELELKFSAAGNSKGSLLKVLHNILELEDSAQQKLSKYCKTERQYNFEGVAKVSPSSGACTRLLMPAPAPAPKPGSIEDLLSKKK